VLLPNQSACTTFRLCLPIITTDGHRSLYSVSLDDLPALPPPIFGSQAGATTPSATLSPPGVSASADVSASTSSTAAFTSPKPVEPVEPIESTRSPPGKAVEQSEAEAYKRAGQLGASLHRLLADAKADGLITLQDESGFAESKVSARAGGARRLGLLEQACRPISLFLLILCVPWPLTLILHGAHRSTLRSVQSVAWDVSNDLISAARDILVASQDVVSILLSSYRMSFRPTIRS